MAGAVGGVVVSGSDLRGWHRASDGRCCGSWDSTSTNGANEAVFSVAVKGYGIVIWDGDGSWRTFGPTDTLSAMLAARVEYALQTVPAPADEHEAREALLAIAGAGLLSVDCDHEPGQCEGEDPAP
jgi:hypothetical protein